MTQGPILIFDLDGTLIDSAPSILATFARVLEEADISTQVPLQNSLIGPPLPETLSKITGIDDPQRIQALVELFKQHYDGSTYRETVVYPGITKMLNTLNEQGYQLHIATNKRYAPTQLIVEHLGWGRLFKSIYALDRYTPRLPDKTALLMHLLKEQDVPPQHARYIGDKTEDGIAAESNSLTFLAVAWGYGDFGPGCRWHVLNSPTSLLDKLAHEQATY